MAFCDFEAKNEVKTVTHHHLRSRDFIKTVMKKYIFYEKQLYKTFISRFWRAPESDPSYVTFS